MGAHKINYSSIVAHDIVYSVQEIASMLGIGKTKTRELLDSGILPVTKVGRQYFTSPASIQEFLKKNIGKQIFF